jgi:hypothetical protein
MAESLQIGNAEPADADGEELLRGERAQSREATGTGTADYEPPAIHLSRLDQEAGSVQAVGDVQDAPLARQRSR